MISGDSLNTLKVRADQLASATESLAAMFAEEYILLHRTDQVERLKVLHAAIMEQIENVKRDESRDSYQYSMLNNGRKIVGIFTELIAGNDNEGLKIISGVITPSSDELSFGRVLVRIRTGGVPDGVDIINISRLARESHRKEQDVINEMAKANSRLLSEDQFRRLLAWLAEEILVGRRSLPFLPTLTIQIQAAQRLKSGQQAYV